MSKSMFVPDRYFSGQHPTVTVAIPTYNEAAHIESVIAGFLQTEYPKLLEIIVADGGSEDGTQEIVKKMSSVDARVKLISNPWKIQSAALNLMLSDARGDIFARADAHCKYAPDYIENCVEALLESGALNVGGAQRFVATNAFQAGVAMASRSLLGSGGAKYRAPDYNGYADTVFMGCFWKKALLELARERVRKEDSQEVIDFLEKGSALVFDISQVTNEDAELNFRLKEKQSDAIYVSSKIKVEYYPRKSGKALFIQYFKYGRGRYLFFLKHPKNTPLRSKLPLIFISTLFLIVSIDLFALNGRLHSSLIFALFLLLILGESLRVNFQYKNHFTREFWRGKKENEPSFLSRVFWCYIAILIMPIAYFTGNIYQAFRHKILKIENKF